MNLLGCFIDHRITDAFCLALATEGEEPLFDDAQPHLQGYGVGRSVFLWEAEEHPKIWGRTLPADSQRSGTCVSRGTYRACQDSLYWSMIFGDGIGKPVTLAYESIYGGSRINVGKGRLGSGDGSYGAWAAQYVHDFGLLPRGQYGSIDLTKSNEELSVTWGTPRHGVPASILAESAAYKAAACFRCTTTADIRDSIAAGYGVAFCSNVLWQVPDGQSTRRNEDGMCRPVSTGGHCEAIRGVFVDAKGRTCFVRQQSWGDYPRGGGRLKLADGREVELPMGCYGAFEGDVADALKDGEAWSFAPPENLWGRDEIKPSDIR